jgi:hypothetical protein
MLQLVIENGSVVAWAIAVAVTGFILLAGLV